MAVVLAQHQRSLILSNSSGVPLLFSSHEGKRSGRPVLEEGCPVLLLALLHPVTVQPEGTVVNEAPHRAQCIGVPQQCTLGQRPYTVGA